MLFINDVVWADHLTPSEKYLLQYCFICRERLTNAENKEFLSDFTDWATGNEFELQGEITPLSKETWDHINKAVDEIGLITLCIKGTAERRYKRMICNKCYKKSPKPILDDIKQVLQGYCHLQDLRSSEYWEKTWKRFTHERIFTALYGDCDTQLEALQMWSVENTDILSNRTIQQYQAKATKLIEDHAETLIANYKAKGGRIW